MKSIARFSPLIIIILVVVFILYIYKSYEYDIHTPNSTNTGYKVEKVSQGESIDQIAEQLKKDNLVKSEFAFEMYVRLHNLTSKIQSGMYKIYENQNIIQVIHTLEKGSFYKVMLIPEGSRLEQVAQIADSTLSENNSSDKFSEQDFLNLAKDPNQFSSYIFVKQIPTGNSIEGFLFPGSYLIADDTTAKDLITLMLNNFTSNVWNKIQPLNSKNGLSFYQDMILASIIDKESYKAADKPMIADIFLKRYQIGMPLQSDVTLQYALGYSTQEHTWWRSNITTDEINLDSLYNTRKYTGLPPGPIDSPDYDSITAAINPTSNPYYYFLNDASGQIHYAITLQEHEANIQKYLNQ